VLELGPEDIEPPPPFGSKVRVEYLKGMGRVGRGFALLLDLDRVLSAEERAFAAEAVTLEPPPAAGAPPPEARSQAAP